MKEPDIFIKVAITGSGRPALIVRKFLYNEDDNIDSKMALSKKGKWIRIPEGGPYPEDCLFIFSVGAEDYKEDISKALHRSFS